MSKYLNGFFKSPRGLCRVASFHEGVSIYFYDNLSLERFDHSAVPKMVELTMAEVRDCQIFRTEDYVRTLRNTNFMRMFEKESNLPVLLLQASEIANSLVETGCNSERIETSLYLQSMHFVFDKPDLAVLHIDANFRFVDADDDRREFKTYRNWLSVPHALLSDSTFKISDYTTWLTDLAKTKRDRLDEHFRLKVHELETLAAKMLPKGMKPSKKKTVK